ncbi:glycosyl hydrolase family 85-domain-containing protein [Dichomitus squalens]|uniref:Glycosyl hydrolase family 85-domain-containing protein n=1 Tax=Dichomitus squalens TaxID=114155 RepID=A0A4Q9MQ77_9APHY|nr:glycosyl hydrolase family 85-domain-containing protein [Dichomitus squalens]
MLGTLIFEHAESEPDCLRLLVGSLPISRTGPARSNAYATIPVSPHYARLLAEIAYQRGFDGYLLNFEAPLRGGVEQTRALTLWIALLEQELKRKVGSHAEAMWYDSVIVNGQLRWQDRLNSVNLPFFLPSTSFLSNYTWPNTYPSMSARYLLSLDQSTLPRPKHLSDLYIGVDVWGRGSHGGGGFGSYKAISHIDPEFLGLSVALFGQAWTWESEQDKPGWSWKTWWAYERKLWLGPPNKAEHVEVPPYGRKEGEPPCEHGPFRPIADFFPRLPPPNPAVLPFFTTFSPGVGWAWFVRGTKVFVSETGWTDVDKCTSIGDLVFPRPTLAWENGDRDEPVPAATSDISMDDAWLGGSSLLISFSAPGSDAEDAFFRCVWLPIQSLAITPRKSYRMSIMYKVSGPVDTDIGASIKSLAPGPSAEFDVTFAPATSNAPLPGGWTELLIDFSLPLEYGGGTDVLSAAGLVIGFTCEDPSQPVDFSVAIGALSVYANPPSAQHTPLSPKVIWADFASEKPKDSAAVPFAGVLTWGTGVSLGLVPAIRLTSPEDTEAAWMLDHLTPGFAYFNVYVQGQPKEGEAYAPETAAFVGTTGLDGRENRFFVDPVCLPGHLTGAKAARFYVQGVTDRGRVLEWEDCTFVDVDA